jgi:D-cysteine desulfhydrase
MKEISEQERSLGTEFDMIVCAAGSGGTYSIIAETGLILDEDFSAEGLRFIDGYKGLGYAISKDDELKFITDVAGKEGIIRFFVMPVVWQTGMMQ